MAHSRQYRATNKEGDAKLTTPSTITTNPSYGLGCAVRCGAGAGAGWLEGAD